jgi:copper homeostasis protein
LSPKSEMDRCGSMDRRRFADESLVADVLLEVCATSVGSARAAERGGADRIELCTNLAVGGITPDPSLLASVLGAVSIPVHVLIRPRPGGFVYTPAEFDRMCREIEHAKSAGAAGVAIGILLTDRRIDVPRTRALAQLARPLHVTFHRAFDQTADPFHALEDVIRGGADTLLTSGGAPEIVGGSAAIARFHEQAGQRLQIMAGGGLSLSNLTDFVQATGVFCLHGSFRREPGSLRRGTDRMEQRVREAAQLLRSAFYEAREPQPVV